MGFVDAIKSCFSQYVTFSGRACRSEYWYFRLFFILCTLVLKLLILASPHIAILDIILVLGCLLPDISVGVRRLHDTDRSGWFLLLLLLPIIGWIILLIWFCTKGTAGDNRFGPDPLAHVASGA